MNFEELFATAVQALRLNKLRSFLTLLGVIIGVMTVVAVVSVISGLNSYVRDKVMRLSPDVLAFTKFGIIRSHQEWIIARKRKPITDRDMEIVQRYCRSCAAVGAANNVTENIWLGRQKLENVSIQGYTANMSSMMNVDLVAGRFFSSVEDQHSAGVAVIGAAVKDQIFPTVNPIGRTFYIAGYPVRVIGLQKVEGKVLGVDKDTVVFVPLGLLQKVWTSRPDISIFVKPQLGMAGVDATQDEVRTILRSLRHTKFEDDDPFGIVGSQALQTLWKTITAGAFALMLLISGISLVVGAIVIANIMFVSVVERTKEIGLRMALGARRSDIRNQFLLESALLALVGGVFGVLLGSLVAVAVNQVFPAQVKVAFIILGIGVATLTGVLAGLGPSSSAAKLPPIEALRYE